MKRFSTPLQAFKHCCSIVILLAVLLMPLIDLKAQCLVTSQGAATSPGTACGSGSSVSGGAGAYWQATFTNGVYYTFTFSNNSNAQTGGFYCINGTTYSAATTVLNNLSGSINIGFYRNTTTWTATSASLSYVVTTPTLGSPSSVGPIDYCDATGTFGSALTASGTANGTVTWDWGSSDGTWHPGWTTGSSGTCCFPKKVAVSDA
ncbi:MAG: hypothetical protein JWO03_3150, partial [Bacteroidetes bacterium]|nr:hypothetical protein [Bacteroidota bacterium]